MFGELILWTIWIIYQFCAFVCRKNVQESPKIGDEKISLCKIGLSIWFIGEKEEEEEAEAEVVVEDELQDSQSSMSGFYCVMCSARQMRQRKFESATAAVRTNFENENNFNW